MGRPRLLLRGRVATPGGGGPVPVVNAVSVTGVKRVGEFVWFQIQDDGTANKYKFDNQVAAGSLSGVTIDDSGSSATRNFPYTTTSDTIGFVAPPLLGGVDYTIVGYASSNNGTSWSAPFPADEFFGLSAGTYFTPATIATPTLTRTTGSGVTPMQVLIDGVTLFDSYFIRIQHMSSAGTTLEDSYVALSGTALTTPFLLDLSGNTEPSPSPTLSTGAATDVYGISVVSGDFQPGNPAPLSGVTSEVVFISPTDGAGSRYYAFNMTAGAHSVLTAIETATSIGGTDNAQSKTFTVIPSGAQIATGGNFDTTRYFDGIFGAAGTVGAVDIGTYGFPVKIVIDYGVTTDLHQLRLETRPDQASAPSAFTFGPCNAAGTYAGTPPVSQSGVTWSTSVVDRKTYNW